MRLPHVCFCAGFVLTGATFALPPAGCAAAGDKPYRPPEAVLYETHEWRFNDRRGHRVVTENFEVYTTVKEGTLLEAVPQVVEATYGYCRHLIPGARKPQDRMRVYIFGTRSDFEAFTRQFGEARAELLLKVRNGGYSERGVSVVEYVSHATTFPILTHEGFHQFLEVCVNRRVPAWLNEGLAVLCEGQRWGERGILRFDPLFNPVRSNALIDALQRKQTLPLPELLRMNAGHVVGGSSRRISTYYAQLWALLAFIQDDPKSEYALGLKRLLSVIADEDLETYAQAAFVSSGRTEYDFGEQVFRSFICDDLERFEAEYEAFMREISGGA